MSFAAVLLICIVVSGLMALAHKLHFSKQDPNALSSKIFEQGRSFFPIFVLVFSLRSFLVEPFRIPSSSLEPTLLVGDFVLVNKFAYGIRLPVIDQKIIPISSPKRGDVVVFSWPPNDTFDYIKRVIGIPGDKISYHNKKLTINSLEAKQAFLDSTSFLNERGELQDVDKIKETLGKVKHDIYVEPTVPAFDFDITVPDGHYFVMGDNRDNSSDSRYWGFVPDKNLRGRAFLIWMSWNGLKSTVRWPRIGTIIH